MATRVTTRDSYQEKLKKLKDEIEKRHGKTVEQPG